MNLPFTVDQFLGVFQQYNNTVWPLQVVFVLLAVVAVYYTVRPRLNSTKLVSAVLALLWIWMGVVYHLIYFAAINPAAIAFGTLCILQGALFFYTGWMKQSLAFRYPGGLYGLAGALLVLYALVLYPVLGYLLGHVYPQSPTFGLPCPTTIFTFGLLLWTEKKVPLFVLLIPFIWTLIGSSAALGLGMHEDIGLLVAGIGGTLIIIVRNRQFSRNRQEVETPV